VAANDGTGRLALQTLTGWLNISMSSAPTAWTLLLIVGVLKIIWSNSIKAADGFTKHLCSGITLVAAAAYIRCGH